MRIGSAFLLTLGLIHLASPAARAGEADGIAPSLVAIEEMRTSGDVEGAAKCATEFVAKHPEALEAHLAHQDLQLALGREKELLETYRAGVKPADASADAHYLLARLLRGSTVIGELRAALKADPRHFWALVALGIELTPSKAGQTEARTFLDEAQRLRPESAVPVNALGRLEEIRGRNGDAEKLYRSAIELDPALTIARVNLGILLVGVGRQEDAVATLKDAAKRAPKDPMPLMALGMAYSASADTKSCIDYFKRAIDLELNDVTSLNLLANAYINLEQLELAEEALLSAYKKAPGSLTTLVNLAYVCVKSTRFDEATKYSIAALEIDDTSAVAHYVLALVFDHQAHAKKAEIEFRKAAKYADDDPVFARALAAFSASQGDWKTALAEYQKVVKLTGATNDSLMDLAGAYDGAEKAKLAASTYEQVLAADPKRLDAWLQLGIICRRDLRDYKRSLRALKEYLKGGGTDPRVSAWIKMMEAK